MKIVDVNQGIQKYSNLTLKIVIWSIYIIITLMILLMVTDVGARYLFDKPMKYSLEVIELMTVLIAGFALSITALERRHIIMDVLVGRFPKRVRSIVFRIGSVLGFITWGFIAYRVFVSAMLRLEQGPKTSYLHIPLAPFEFTLAIGLFLFCLIQLIQTFQPVVEEMKQEEGPSI